MGFCQWSHPGPGAGRHLSPEEVAKVIAFICSPEVAAVSSAAVLADGGVIRAAM